MRIMRPGLLIGFGAGYVMGSKAGHERYKQIQDLWHRLTSSAQAKQLSHEVQQTMSTVGDAVSHKASEGVDAVSEGLEHARERISQTTEHNGAR